MSAPRNPYGAQCVISRNATARWSAHCPGCNWKVLGVKNLVNACATLIAHISWTHPALYTQYLNEMIESENEMEIVE